MAAASDLALIGVAILSLWLGATQVVTGATGIAHHLGLPGLVVGLTVVAFGTSAPEFAVTLDAALIGRADISVGNVVGSNILNLGFVLGGAALIAAIPTARALVRRDCVALFGTTLLVFWFVSDLQIARLEGAVLVGLLGGYLLVVLGSERDPRGQGTDTPLWDRRIGVGRLVAGLVAVVVGAHLLVIAASSLARAAGLSEWLIGVTLVAAGTSLPEFVTSVVAINRGRAGISAGNLVGSCVFNFLGVLGVAAVVRPLTVGEAALESLAWLLGIVLIVSILFWSNRVLSRLEGAVLVGLNAVNWLSSLLT